MQRTGYEKKKEGKTNARREEEGERGSLKRINWDAIFDRKLIKVTALVTRKEVTANEKIRDFRRKIRPH